MRRRVVLGYRRPLVQIGLCQMGTLTKICLRVSLVLEIPPFPETCIVIFLTPSPSPAIGEPAPSRYSRSHDLGKSMMYR